MDLTPTVYNIIDTILDFLRINKYTTCLRRDARCSEYLVDAFPEVYGPSDAAVFRRMLRGAHLRSEDVDEILNHVREKGSCFVPRLTPIFLGRLASANGAEEALTSVTSV